MILILKSWRLLKRWGLTTKESELFSNSYTNNNCKKTMVKMKKKMKKKMMMMEIRKEET